MHFRSNLACYCILLYPIFQSPLLTHADYNHSITPPTAGSDYHAPSGEEYDLIHNGYNIDGPFHKPAPPSFPGMSDQQIWLVSVLQYLLVINQDSLSPISATPLLLPILISGSYISQWFAGDLAEEIAIQNGYTLTGHANLLTDSILIPMHQTPTYISNKNIVIPTDQSSLDNSASNSNALGQGGGSPNSPDNSGDSHKPPSISDTSSCAAKKQCIIVEKEIKVGGHTYTIKAYLYGLNERLYCYICHDLITPSAKHCTYSGCQRSVCLRDYEHSESIQTNCPLCQQSLNFIDVNYEKEISQLLWYCPECQHAFLESEIADHIKDCAPSFHCDFKEKGCQVTGTYNQVSEHESTCEYRPISCPNTGCTKVILKANLPWHRASCHFQPAIIPGTNLIRPSHEVHLIRQAIAEVNSPESHSLSQPVADSVRLLVTLLQQTQPQIQQALEHQSERQSEDQTPCQKKTLHNMLSMQPTHGRSFE